MSKSFRLKELRRVLSLTGKDKLSFISILLYWSACYPTILFVFSFLTKTLFNAVEYKQGNLLVRAFFIGLTAILFQCISVSTSGYLFEKKILLIVKNIRLKVFEHIEKLPITYFENVHSGDLISRMNSDIDTLSEAYHKLYSFLECIMLGVGSAFIIITLDWRLALFLTVLGLIFTTINTKYTKPIQIISDKIQKSIGISSQNFLDIVMGIRVIKIFNNNDIIDKFTLENTKLAKEQLTRVSRVAQMNSFNFMFSILNVVGTLIVGSFMISRKYIDLGTVMAVISLQGAFSELFLYLGSSIVELQTSLAGAQRIFELFDEKEEPERIVGDAKSKCKEMIKMENITFSHDNSRVILNDVNISAKKGQTVALVGPSGAGKSTIIKIFMGFYMPNSGSIYMEGRSATSYTIKEMREKITYVSQDIYLFDGTIEENIRLGKLDATIEEIVNASKLANAHNFIEEFSDKYDTKVGEKGVRLSGGQKQRIAIARAILKNAQILLLDEATSALDSENEKLVQQSLNILMKDRTSIIVTHRLLTIEKADIIYVLNNGRTIEKGRHDELLKHDGMYKKLYNII